MKPRSCQDSPSFWTHEKQQHKQNEQTAANAASRRRNVTTDSNQKINFIRPRVICDHRCNRASSAQHQKSLVMGHASTVTWAEAFSLPIKTTNRRTCTNFSEEIKHYEKAGGGRGLAFLIDQTQRTRHQRWRTTWKKGEIFNTVWGTLKASKGRSMQEAD
jgi:hypothetical protein